jgi:MFS family permease
MVDVERLPVAFANIGHTLTHLLMLLWPTVVLGLEGRFGLSYGELLWLSFPGVVLYGVAALPAGWLGDRWSAEGMMLAFFFGSGAAAILTGLATGPLGFSVGLALIGVFGSIYHPVGIAWLVRHARSRGKMLAWNGIFGSLGVGIAPFFAASMIALSGWRAAFIVPGVVCLAVGLALALSVRSGVVKAVKTDRVPMQEPSRADAWRVFVVLSITMTSAGIVWQAMTVALPKLFDDRLVALTHGGVIGTGGLVSLVFALSALAQLLGGSLADRYPMKWVYVLAWVLPIPLLLSMTRLFELPLLSAVMLVFCSMVIATPAENSLLAQYTPGKWRATAFGAKFVLSLGVSAAGVPLVAFIHDRTGDFAWLFLILGVLAAIVAGAGLLLPRGGDAVAAPTPVPAE